MRFTGPFSLAFPLVVVGFVPLRLYVLPKFFTHEELELLDHEGSEMPHEIASNASGGDSSQKKIMTGTEGDVYLPLPAWRSWMS